MRPKLVVPANITLLFLPPRASELNPVENVWQFMRDNWLSNRVVADPMEATRRMQEERLLDHIGIRTRVERPLGIAREIAPIVCVQNGYNLVHRADDAMIDARAADGIACAPYVPLGGFTPLQADRLTEVAVSPGQTARAIALVWLLERSPNGLVIPGTSRRTHLQGNVAAASLRLSADRIRQLDECLDAG